jgi:hypothetical protein
VGTYLTDFRLKCCIVTALKDHTSGKNSTGIRNLAGSLLLCVIRNISRASGMRSSRCTKHLTKVSCSASLMKKSWGLHSEKVTMVKRKSSFLEQHCLKVEGQHFSYFPTYSLSFSLLNPMRRRLGS